MEKPIIKSIVQDTYYSKIEIIAEKGTIYYTTDGTGPSEMSMPYSVPFDYPTPNTEIKAIAINGEERSDVSTFTCMLSCPPGRLNAIIQGATTLLVSEPLDFCNEASSFVECMLVGRGSFHNVKNMSFRGFVYPLGFDFDKYFVNAGDFAKYRWCAGQILTKDNKLIRYDGKMWYTLQEIHSGTFAVKPSADIPVGFAYFCLDRKTTEGNSNGIMIYHKGNNIWVDANGVIVDDNYPPSNWTLIE